MTGAGPRPRCRRVPAVAEAVARRLRGGVLEREGTSVAVLQSDTRDHYRTFQMLERLLHAPPRLLQQLLFQIPPERQALLVQRYYAFDEVLARELLGKKLSKGTKKELDEVSARTGVGIRSCRRQFDNFKRVFKAVEELRGPLAENIQQLFLLPPPLARSALRGKISVYNELEANFKALSRALVNVGGKLTHARDVRDFFVDLVEKVIEPCRSDKWSPGDLRLFLAQYTAAPRNLAAFRHQALWERYMAAISACLLRMYHD
ncbi:PREDICTED: acidic fibroblast growth factor intracellular-binding protein [Sturnus vulgaris]|uniref:acidic fibroblast growth factor intracellular-binding protein n=1 Tax=Sturnus vulgaris TaxID=9172 RepID=UPI000719F40A|nr:PREDICTED: acidic fibroblast growth factor intracellular-binding protein [Sturnus vulgaris]